MISWCLFCEEVIIQNPLSYKYSLNFIIKYIALKLICEFSTYLYMYVLSTSILSLLAYFTNLKMLT